MLLAPQGFLSVSGLVAGAVSQSQQFTSGITTDDITLISGPLDISQNGSSVRLLDSGNSNNVVASIGDSAGNGGILQLFNDAGSATAVIRSYAVSNIQGYFTAGRMGFGTSSPTSAVHLYGAGPMLMTVENTTASSYSGMLFKADSGSVAFYFGGTTQSAIPNGFAAYVNTGSFTGYAWSINAAGKMGVRTTSASYILDVAGEIGIRELSSDPGDPAEGRAVLWQSDGTGTGDDGDILVKITAGATTKTVTLVDFSAV